METKQDSDLKEEKPKEKVIDTESPMRSGDSINAEKQNTVKEEKKDEANSETKQKTDLKEEKPIESPIRSNEEQRSENEEKKKKDLFERYELIKFLGSGAFGTVHLVRDKNINQMFVSFINNSPIFAKN